MKKQHLFAFSALLALSASFLAGCSGKSSFTVKWNNYDGKTLETDNNVKKGSDPSYDGKTPYRLEDSSKYYVFKGWSPELAPVKKDITYTAQYAEYDLNAVNETPDGYNDVLPENTKDGNIFHAFCWKFTDIEDKLGDIANAGFKSVQISPVQQPKSGGAEWWAFYQPLSFSIADNSLLGTKAQLQSMCEKADELGISIIADIVFNHLANISDDELEADGTPKVFPGVEAYEPYIYQHRNDATNPTFHHNKNAEGSGAVTQHYPYGGLPDLNTANEYVQQRSLDLLKECIDVGIDGFRFDAAKHIETPDDPQYPSNFWPNVLDPAKEYYRTKTSKDLYLYGEILGGPEGGRTLDIYTKLMNVCEDVYGSTLRGAINGYAAPALNRYGKNTDASNLVTWIESHDTFAHEKSHIDNEKILRGYAIAATRKGARALYLSRTDDSFTVGKVADHIYESNVLGAVNRFRSRFGDGEEYQFAESSLYVNQRVNGNAKGAIIIDLNPDGKVAVSLDKLGTGVYYDQITGQAYTIRNGHLILDMPQSGIVVLTQSKNPARPTADIDFRDSLFVGSKELNLKVGNATSAKYSINGGAEVSFTNEAKITIGDVVDSDNKVQLKVTVANEKFSLTRTYYYQKVQLIDGYFNIVNVNPKYFTDNELYIWTWTSSSPGHWSKGYTVQSGIVLVDVTGLEGLILAVFEKDYVISKVNEWDSAVIRQTPDIKGSTLAQGYFDASDL